MALNRTQHNDVYRTLDLHYFSKIQEENEKLKKENEELKKKVWTCTATYRPKHSRKDRFYAHFVVGTSEHPNRVEYDVKFVLDGSLGIKFIDSYLDRDTLAEESTLIYEVDRRISVTVELSYFKKELIDLVKHHATVWGVDCAQYVNQLNSEDFKFEKEDSPNFEN